ncbi:HDR131Cp [Eremothecium sinecaudum]|uniref:HDR131Cp n=1 Tax=Eremothecium sinecaudum TaxID=45286 RepID=A0A0X8HT16_9SACH|nr:HDR131Cp [Eremothecium sinecaudum]AMD20873.1 HDR131Cp [Eremothecium sinecaudum]
MPSHLFQPTDIVLAKVKGYPSWPAMIIPNEIIPANVIRLHRRNQKFDEEEVMEDEESDADDTKYIRYSEHLKFRKFETAQSSYCLKFLCDDTYTWTKAQDMKLLSPDQCKSWLEGTTRSKKKQPSKNKKLIQAYEMAMRGSDIDVWEFVEYGSAGRPEEDEEEEYVEEEDSPVYEEDAEELDDESLSDDEDVDEEISSRRSSRQKRAARPVSKPTRSSKRQRAARQKRELEDKPTRRTRASASRGESVSVDFDEDENEDELEDSDIGEELPAIPTRSSAKANAGLASKQASNKKKKPAEPERYKYEDDEDWRLVGMGTQDLTIPSSNPLVNRLSQKKHLELHNEMKQELQEKLLMVNKLMLESILSPKTRKDDLELVLEELDLALSMRGAHNELITVFLFNNELLMNFRALFNLKQPELGKLNLWNRFMDIFQDIYGYEFILDTQAWSFDAVNVTDEPQQVPVPANEEPNRI